MAVQVYRIGKSIYPCVSVGVFYLHKLDISIYQLRDVCFNLFSPLVFNLRSTTNLSCANLGFCLK